MANSPDLRNAQWRKSSYSGNTGGDCVEVADGFPGTVPVRDSKNTDGTVLLIRPDTWRAFVDGLR
ncbi:MULTISPECIES: DUF397 domain-containing protein [Streptomyces]|jgi:hypothetical protein|uniref:DUF397 domain-containing protein n=2 Tax=Streptomyces bottropensis TaxID=42235 RepID=M3DGG8_9ACTN|nr:MULTISPECIES: DUF397 domain-containing protein [Streptomyces]EMF55777.1 hypothetical protein SBD_3090 [Streptomyces bottropensis ATCC 25435]MZD16332.1 DUF397 domain-containing protein [Streptomyces sp. SID5476]